MAWHSGKKYASVTTQRYALHIPASYPKHPNAVDIPPPLFSIHPLCRSRNLRKASVCWWYFRVLTSVNSLLPASKLAVNSDISGLKPKGRIFIWLAFKVSKQPFQVTHTIPSVSKQHVVHKCLFCYLGIQVEILIHLHLLFELRCLVHVFCHLDWPKRIRCTTSLPFHVLE